MTDDSDPLLEYILAQIDHFSEESKRLGTSAPLHKYKEITDAFETIQSTLGTLNHEVALDAAKHQFQKARREVLSGLHGVWRSFWATRRHAEELRRKEQQSRSEAQERLAQLEKLVGEISAKGGPIAEHARSALAAAQGASQFDLEFSPLWRKTSWVRLRIDAKIIGIYLRYMLSRLRVFITFHGFIFLVPILVLGIGYSATSKSLIEYVASLGPELQWLAAGLTILAYALKKYYFDKKLKKLQVTLETRLLRSLSEKLLIARTVALQVRTSRKGRYEA